MSVIDSENIRGYVLITDVFCAECLPFDFDWLQVTEMLSGDKLKSDETQYCSKCGKHL